LLGCQRIFLENSLTATVDGAESPAIKETGRQIRPTGSAGDVVRFCRERKGWSAAILAEKAKLTETTVLNFERTSRARGSTRSSVAEALGIPVEWIAPR
jgi:ribosome-binding protein aMBF1 (putative translation factor)